MTNPSFDAVIIGSGAGGAAAAYRPANAGKRVLVLERGGHLPRDGSTLEQHPSRSIWWERRLAATSLQTAAALVPCSGVPETRHDR